MSYNYRKNSAVLFSMGKIISSLVLSLSLLIPVYGGELKIHNGWLNYNDTTIFGFGQISSLWRWRKPNIARNDPGNIGPNRTEDLDKLTDNMRAYGYPGLEHNIGLWYDRRRDEHLSRCRINDKVKSPFLEQPWARTNQGTSCDGLPKYDLTTFNPWYFERLRKFASLSDQKGTILYNNFYNQHAFLEVQPHYVDYAWRPGNAIQDTGMPDQIPAANAFYDVSHTGRRELHKMYIRKVLDEIGEFGNVFHFTSGEYTGNADFIKFWIDTIVEWEKSANEDVKIGLATTLDVMEEILADPIRSQQIDALDLRFFWYRENGKLHAISGGKEIPGRKYDGDLIAVDSSPTRIYQQTALYRERFPDKVLFHAFGLNKQYFLSFLMGGGSLAFSDIYYIANGRHRPDEYVSPEGLAHMQRVIGFLNDNLSSLLFDMTPESETVNLPENVFALSSENSALIYFLQQTNMDLSQLKLKGSVKGIWFNPDGDANKLNQTTELFITQETQTLTPPTDDDWLLLLTRP